MPAVANSIITPQAPKSAHIVQSFTATTTPGTTTPANTVLLVTAGANGGRLVKLRAQPVATVTVTQLQEFRSLDTGTTKKWVNSALGASAGYTLAATTLPPVADFGYSDSNPLIMAGGEQIYVGAAVTGSWSFEAEWADY
jgi:hypothetical protein